MANVARKGWVLRVCYMRSVIARDSARAAAPFVFAARFDSNLCDGSLTVHTHNAPQAIRKKNRTPPPPDPELGNDVGTHTPTCCLSHTRPRTRVRVTHYDIFYTPLPASQPADFVIPPIAFCARKSQMFSLCVSGLYSHNPDMSTRLLHIITYYYQYRRKGV